jgi:hypothetical protein
VSASTTTRSSIRREKSLEVDRLVDGRWVEVDSWNGDVMVRALAFDLSTLWRR